MLQVPNDCSKEFSEDFSERYHLLGPHAIDLSQKPSQVPHENNKPDPKLPANFHLTTALETIYENW